MKRVRAMGELLERFICRNGKAEQKDMSSFIVICWLIESSEKGMVPADGIDMQHAVFAG
jgi:hypothetical protein